MLPYQLDLLDEAKLLELIDDQAAETLGLEFKRELPGKTPEAKAEFLKDVAALANAEGGDIVYGIEEKGGQAFRLLPLSGVADVEKRRLGQLLDGGLEPRIPGTRMQDVPVRGGFVLVLRVPRSFSGPHRISLNNDRRFPIRSGTHTAEMSYAQLRAGFDRSATLFQLAKNVRQERLQLVRDGLTPKPINSGPTCVVQVVPFSSLEGRIQIDVAALNRNPVGLLNIDLGENATTLNLDGVVTFGVARSGPLGYSYTQIFRSGQVESAFLAGAGYNEGKTIPSTFVTDQLRKALLRSVRLLTAAGTTGPAILGLAMLKVKGYSLGVGGFPGFQPTLADRDELVVPETFVEHIDDLQVVQQFDEAVKPLMDILWQSFGVERCLEYTDQGEWKPRP